MVPTTMLPFIACYGAADRCTCVGRGSSVGRVVVLVHDGDEALGRRLWCMAYVFSNGLGQMLGRKENAPILI